MDKLTQNQPDNSRWQKVKKALEIFLVPEEANRFLPQGLESKYLFGYGAGLLILKIAVISLVLILPSTHLFSNISSQSLLSLINQVRQEKSLSPLTLNNQLSSAALLKADDMIANDYFEHISPTGVTPWYWMKKAGYNFDYAGENLAMDFFETNSVFQAWMNSPSHRDNILNPNYREIGIAVESGQMGERSTTLAVLDFGSQQSPKTPAVSKSPSPSPPAATPKVSATPKPVASVKPTPSISATTPTSTNMPTPISSPEESVLAMKSVLTAGTPEPTIEPDVASVETKISASPRVLGVFVSRFDEMAKAIYLYFTLLLIMALGVNIFVKIRIQRWPTILATVLIIALSTALIFI